MTQKPTKLPHNLYIVSIVQRPHISYLQFVIHNKYLKKSCAEIGSGSWYLYYPFSSQTIFNLCKLFLLYFLLILLTN